MNDDFKPGEWVWYIRTKHTEESYNCHSCKTHVVKQHQEKMVDRAKIEVITDQRFLQASRRSYTLSNPENKVYGAVLWQGDNELSPIWRTKEEAEVALIKQAEKKTTKVLRNDDLYDDQEN